MKINVQHAAKLANLIIKKKEVKKFESQLSAVLIYFKKLEEVDTSIKSTSRVTTLENVTRQDEIKSSLSQEEVLSNTKQRHNGHFKVPAILE